MRNKTSQYLVILRLNGIQSKAHIKETDEKLNGNRIFRLRCYGYHSIHAHDTIAKIERILEKFLVKKDMLSYTILQNDDTTTLNEIFYQNSVEVNFNPLALPFIEDVEKYIESYFTSDALLLILQGEAGTGKSTFVKQILKTMQQKVKNMQDEFKVSYSFDENIFYLSDFYRWIIYIDTYNKELF